MVLCALLMIRIQLREFLILVVSRHYEREALSEAMICKIIEDRQHSDILVSAIITINLFSSSHHILGGLGGRNQPSNIQKHEINILVHNDVVTSSVENVQTYVEQFISDVCIILIRFSLIINYCHQLSPHSQRTQETLEILQSNINIFIRNQLCKNPPHH